MFYNWERHNTADQTGTSTLNWGSEYREKRGSGAWKGSQDWKQNCGGTQNCPKGRVEIRGTNQEAGAPAGAEGLGKMTVFTW